MTSKQGVKEKCESDNKPQRAKFTEKEDQLLRTAVLKYGTLSWNIISKLFGNRTPRQCRDRWNNYLSPLANNTKWTLEEDELLMFLYQKYGSRWAQIAKYFNGRTCQSIRTRCCKICRLSNRVKNGIKPKQQHYHLHIRINECSNDAQLINELPKQNNKFVLPPCKDLPFNLLVWFHLILLCL